MEIVAIGFWVLGSCFILAGTVGILRFPDVYTRLHALTKADNLGLGLVVAGLSLEADSLAVALKLWFTWVLVLLGSSIACQLVARSAQRSGLAPWRRP